MTVIWAMLLFLVLLSGWVLTLLGMPGNWLMLVSAALYAWLGPAASRASIGWPVVVALLGLALFGELVEFLAGALGVAKVGGSRRGAVFALIGSLLGGLAGLFVGVPIPLIGPLVAAVLFAGLGAMLGAILGEAQSGRTFDQRWQIGKAAFWGRLLGTLGKVAVGSVMVALAATALVV